MELVQILERVTTLSAERKAELVERSAAGTLTDEDKQELNEHLQATMKVVQKEVDVAQELLSDN